MRAGTLTVTLATLLVGLALTAAPAPAVLGSATVAPTPTATLDLRLSGLPVLLTEFGTAAFAVRPATVVPYVDGGMVIGKLVKHGGRIHWHTWSSSSASGAGTLWIDNGIPDMASGTYHGHSATVHAYRVRDGRFTRLTVRYRESGKHETKTWALGKLTSTTYSW